MMLRVATPARFFLPLLLAVSIAGCRPHDFPQYPLNYREYAYVPNGGSGTVTILDVVNVRLDRELKVGQNPVAVAAGADGLLVEVHDHPEAALSDGPQSIYPEQFRSMMNEIEQIAPIVERSLPRGIHVGVAAG